MVRIKNVAFKSTNRCSTAVQSVPGASGEGIEQNEQEIGSQSEVVRKDKIGYKSMARKSTASSYSAELRTVLETKHKEQQKENGKEVDKEKEIVKKKIKKFRRGTVALREIRRYQSTVNNLIPARSFQKFLRSILREFELDVTFKVEAISALQTAAEAYLVNLFENATLLSCHANRVTLQPKDLALALRLNRNTY